ncbi:hypothetical protein ACH5RR_026825 [Cinchona calisaya]|uniref:Endonuclease/exonuclease/phosphatase domain-containing protein n=1 Tax=Cinchona calisaya TaxID=153742 RepID=A0ABD2Z3P7_9GENT
MENGVARVRFCWNGSAVNYSLLSMHDQAITCNVQHTSKNCVIILVYACNSTVDKRPLWKYLSVVKNNLQGRPWIILGDFNSIRCSAERLGNVDFDDQGMEDFNECIDVLDIVEHHAKGYYYTWCNKRDGGNRLYSKIDRVLVNNNWLNEYPYVKVEILDPSISDHCPLFVQIKENISFGPKSFKFQQFRMITLNSLAF